MSHHRHSRHIPDSPHLHYSPTIESNFESLNGDKDMVPREYMYSNDRPISQSSLLHEFQQQQSISSGRPPSVISTQSTSGRLSTEHIRRVLDRLQTELNNERMRGRTAAKERKELQRQLDEKTEQLAQQHEVWQTRLETIQRERQEQEILKEQEIIQLREELRNERDRHKDQMRQRINESEHQAIRMRAEIKQKEDALQSIERKYQRLLEKQEELRSQLSEGMKQKALLESRVARTTESAATISSSPSSGGIMSHLVEFTKSLNALREDLDAKLNKVGMWVRGSERNNSPMTPPSRSDLNSVVAEIMDNLKELRAKVAEGVSTLEKGSDRMQYLEMTVKRLRSENTDLKRAKEQQSTSGENPDELVKLRIRNAELNAQLKKLDENYKKQWSKHAALLVENETKKIREQYDTKMEQLQSSHSTEQSEWEKKLVNLQQALSQAETLSKTSNVSYIHVKDAEQKLRISEQERILLEKQISWKKDELDANPVARERNKSLHNEMKILCEDNERLKKEIASLRNNSGQHRLQLENSSKSHKKELLDSQQTIIKLQAELKTLTSETVSFGTKHKGLKIQLAEVEKQKNEQLEKLQTQVNQLGDQLATCETEKANSQKKVEQMEALIKHLQDAEDKKRLLEQEFSRLQAELEVKQKVLENGTNEKESVRRQQEEVVETLQSKLRELEKRRALQILRHEEILLEMEALKMRNRHNPDLYPSVSRRSVQPNVENGETSHPMVSSHSHQNVTSSGTDRVAHSSGAPLRAYMAKYSYDPFSQSPNDNPEMELPLKAGDYIVVRGHMDEDGFFFGELTNGRQGLVPSNFVQPVNLDDLNSEMSESAAEHVPITNETHFQSMVPLPRVPLNAIDDVIDLEEGSVVGSEMNSVRMPPLANSKTDGLAKNVPPPRQLCLERQLSTGIVISWLPPLDLQSELSAKGLPSSASAIFTSNRKNSFQANTSLSQLNVLSVDPLTAYHIYVNGQFRMSISANSDKTKALLDGIQYNKLYRISVRAVTMRGQSRDEECTVLLSGVEGVLCVPSRLKATHITSTTAKLRWMPGNSNCPHSIVLNGTILATCPSMQYKVLLTGLTPDYLHKVILRAELHELVTRFPVHRKRTTASLELRTLPVGAPESPSQVNAECGTHSGDILVTWAPISLENTGLSNGLTVIGYRIYVNNVCLKEVNGASVDHIMLQLNTFQLISNGNGNVTDKDEEPPLNLFLTMRTIATVPSGPLPTSTATNVETSLRDGILYAYAQSSSLPLPPKLLAINAAQIIYSKTQNVEQQSSTLSGGQGDVIVESVDSKPPYLLSAPFMAQVAGTAASAALMLGDQLSQRLRMVDLPVEEYSSYQKGVAFLDNNLTSVPLMPSQNHVPTSNDSTRKSIPTSRERRDMGPTSMEADDARSGRVVNVPEIHITKDSSFSDEDPLLMQRRMTTSKHQQYMNSRQHAVPIPEQHSRQQQQHQQQVPPPHQQDQVVSSINGSQKPRRQARSTGTLNQDVSTDEILENRPSVISKNNAVWKGESGYPSIDPSSMKEPPPPRLPPTKVGPNTVRTFIALYDYDPATMSPNPDGVEHELPFRESQLIRIFGDCDEDGFYVGESNGRRGLVPYNMVQEIPPSQLPPQQIQQQQAQMTPGPVPGTGTGTNARPVRGRQHERANMPQQEQRLNLVTEEHKQRGQNQHLREHPSVEIVQGHHSANAPPRSSTSSVRESMRSNRSESTVSHQVSVTSAEQTIPSIMRRMVALYAYDPHTLSPNVDSEAELAFSEGDVIRILSEIDEDGFYYGEAERTGGRGLVPSNFLQDCPPQAGQRVNGGVSTNVTVPNGQVPQQKVVNNGPPTSGAAMLVRDRRARNSLHSNSVDRPNPPPVPQGAPPNPTFSGPSSNTQQPPPPVHVPTSNSSFVTQPLIRNKSQNSVENPPPLPAEEHSSSSIPSILPSPAAAITRMPFNTTSVQPRISSSPPQQRFFPAPVMKNESPLYTPQQSQQLPLSANMTKSVPYLSEELSTSPPSQPPLSTVTPGYNVFQFDDDMPIALDLSPPRSGPEKKKKLSLTIGNQRRLDTSSTSSVNEGSINGEDGVLERKRSVFKNPFRKKGK